MISDKAVVETTMIGDQVTIHPFAVVREGAVLGNGVVIHPFVVIESGVTIGDDTEVFPGSYIGKEPKGAGATARVPQFERRVTIGSHCSVGPNATIFFDVQIGNNTLIGDGASIREQCHVGERSIIGRYVTLNYNARVGDRTKIMDLSHVTGNCSIGNDVFISVHVSMTNDRAIGRAGYQEEVVQGPRIGNGVMVGVGANLLPGITIGDHAVVIASAVVNKDVPAQMMVAGNPARIIQDLSASKGGR